MKGFNIKSRWSGFFAKGIKALLLLVVLQAYSCGGAGASSFNRGEAYDIATKTPLENFREKIEEELKNRKISIFQDEVGRSLFHVLTEKKEEKKLSIALEVCNKKCNDKELHSAFIKALNALDPKTKKTPLGMTISTNNIFAFDLLLNQEDIDINKAGECTTSLVFALVNKNSKICSILLKKDNIDITTPHPTSGNTPAHSAIKNHYWDIAVELIKRLLEKKEYEALFSENTTKKDTICHSIMKHPNEKVHTAFMQGVETLLQSEHKDQTLKFLFTQNKELKTPLHIAMECKQERIAEELIKIGLKHENIKDKKLWSKDNQGRTALDVGVGCNQHSAILLIHQMPLDDIFKSDEDKSDKNKKALVHRIFDLRNLEFFTAVCYRIDQLKKADSSNAVVEQVKKYFSENSIWEVIYLSKVLHRGPLFYDKDNITTFRDFIKALKNILEPKDWEPIQNAILNNIKSKERAKLLEWFKGHISKDYVDKLCKIVNGTAAAA